MNLTRRVGALSALALTFVLAACNTPDNLVTPSLKSQFGTDQNDFGVDVATASSGRIYVLSVRETFQPAEGYDGAGIIADAFLSRYDNNGSLLWSRMVASGSCSYDYSSCDDESNLGAHAAAADTRGYGYSLTSHRSVPEDCYQKTFYSVDKYDASGKLIRSVDVGHNSSPSGISNTGADFTDTADFTVDGSGNLYVVRQLADFDDDHCSAVLSNSVAKYSATGGLQWQQLSTVGTLYAVSLASNGNLFVAGATGVARLTTAGKIVWTKSGIAENVTTSGTNTVYIRYHDTIRKLDANGKQLWSKIQSGLNGMVIGDMTSDANGNVYLTGKYNASSGNRDVFTRKLNSSGKVLWTKTFGTSAYDDAKGIATVNGNEIYLTGATQGSLAHAFRGGEGESDGYIRKLNSSGNPVWTR